MMSMKKIVMMATMATVLFISGCSRTPLPDDLSISPPPDNIPRELADLSGGWEGSHINGLSIRKIVVIFSNITRDEITFIYSYGDSRSTKYGNRSSNDSAWQLLKGKVTNNGSVIARTKGGSVILFKWNSDGRLVEEFTDSNGTSTRIFRPIPPEKLKEVLAQ